MGKKIRIGNDIQVQWTLSQDLTGRNLTVHLVAYGYDVEVPDATFTGHVVAFTFYGKDQRKAGSYGIRLVENRNGVNMVTADILNVFTLVHHSKEAGGAAGTGIVPQVIII